MEGPNAFRKALRGLPWHNDAENTLIDIGNIYCQDDELEASQETLKETVSILQKQKIRTMVIGGGHELAWGHFQGLPDLNYAIINFDAHFDLRPPLENNRGTSGSSFLQIANDYKAKGKAFDYTCFGIQKATNTASLFKHAEELNVRFMEAEEFQSDFYEKAFGMINSIITKHDAIYVSLCMDVFAAPFSPGVSAPQPLGIYPYHVIPLLRKLASSGKVIAFDIPNYRPS